MNFTSLIPPASFSDDYKLHTLQAMIKNDQSGDKTRELVRYFRQSDLEATKLKVQTSDFEEKQFADLVSNALAASEDIVTTVWKETHDRELFC